MGLIERNALVESLSPPLDRVLAAQLVDEFISAERRYIQRDWEPAELDGGQFAEALARIIYHQDSGTLNHTKKVSEYAEYIESSKVPHAMPRQDALHLMKVVQTIYKFRSARGAVHITPKYSANHMDAKLVIECVRWAMNETLRLFWNSDREKVAKAIRELLQFDVPCIGVFEDVIMVQRTDLSVDEEILILLHYAGEQGFTRRELGTHCMRANQRVSEAIRRLEDPKCRLIVLQGSSRYRLTDWGAKHVRENLADKLLLH